tara:strand:- start:35 stop:205 length:171 start_codon:yes stop_codon:yes gene_type:complete
LIETEIAVKALLVGVFVATLGTLWFVRTRLTRQDIAYTILGVMIGGVAGALVFIWS